MNLEEKRAEISNITIAEFLDPAETLNVSKWIIRKVGLKEAVLLAEIAAYEQEKAEFGRDFTMSSILSDLDYANALTKLTELNLI